MADEPLASTVDENQALPSPSRKTRFKATGSEALLLVVEDNRADALLVRHAIEHYKVPVRVVIAEDGEEALDYFAAAESDPAAPCPDILLLDLNLPKKSGLEVLEKIRASTRCKDIRTVILTSSDSTEDRRRTAQLGAIRYFRKPTSYLEFLKIGEVLRDVLNQIH